MNDHDAQVPWTNAQWNLVTTAVTQEANRTRVAASFLPSYGPLPASTQVVSAEQMGPGGNVNDVLTIPMIELFYNVNLSGQQVHEEELSNAAQAFRRGAAALAQAEDWIIFNGFPAVLPGRRGWPPPLWPPNVGIGGIQPAGSAAPATNPGLLNPVPAGAPAGGIGALGNAPGVGVVGQWFDPANLVTSIVAAVAALEGAAHPSPFVCVLSLNGYVSAFQLIPGTSVMPKDQIEPFLKSELLKSAMIPQADGPRGVVTSLAGAPIDLALAVDISPQFLQVNPGAQYAFRVYERFALRIKQADAVVQIVP